eukprot:1128754-Rhodomonas_salina.3
MHSLNRRGHVNSNKRGQAGSRTEEDAEDAKGKHARNVAPSVFQRPALVRHLVLFCFTESEVVLIAWPRHTLREHCTPAECAQAVGGNHLACRFPCQGLLRCAPTAPDITITSPAHRTANRCRDHPEPHRDNFWLQISRYLFAIQNGEPVVGQEPTRVPLGPNRGAEDDDVFRERSVEDSHGAHRTTGHVEDPCMT